MSPKPSPLPSAGRALRAFGSTSGSTSPASFRPARRRRPPARAARSTSTARGQAAPRDPAGRPDRPGGTRRVGRRASRRGLADRSIPKAAARALYEDDPAASAEVLEARRLDRLLAPRRDAGRPDKRDRRDRIRWPSGDAFGLDGRLPAWISTSLSLLQRAAQGRPRAQGRHRPRAAEDPRKFASVDDAIGALKGADEEREKKFSASIEAEKSKKDVLNRKFQELFEKTKGDTSKPVRDIDLD